MQEELPTRLRKDQKSQLYFEPMNPYERRIIHSALRGNKYVETVSEGEEPYRHVVVKLKDGKSCIKHLNVL